MQLILDHLNDGEEFGHCRDLVRKHLVDVPVLVIDEDDEEVNEARYHDH